MQTLRRSSPLQRERSTSAPFLRFAFTDEVSCHKLVDPRVSAGRLRIAAEDAHPAQRTAKDLVMLKSLAYFECSRNLALYRVRRVFLRREKSQGSYLS